MFRKGVVCCDGGASRPRNRGRSSREMREDCSAASKLSTRVRAGASRRAVAKSAPFAIERRRRARRVARGRTRLYARMLRRGTHDRIAPTPVLQPSRAKRVRARVMADALSNERCMFTLRAWSCTFGERATLIDACSAVTSEVRLTRTRLGHFDAARFPVAARAQRAFADILTHQPPHRRGIVPSIRTVAASVRR